MNNCEVDFVGPAPWFARSGAAEQPFQSRHSPEKFTGNLNMKAQTGWHIRAISVILFDFKWTSSDYCHFLGHNEGVGI